MNNISRRQIIFTTIILVVLALIITFFVKGNINPKKKSPYKEDIELGEIKEDEDDNFEGSGETEDNHVIDSNKVTYLRRDIPVLNTSMLIPQGWSIKEKNGDIFMTPPEDSDISKIQVAMHMEDSFGTRNPEDLHDFFKEYREQGFIYYNKNFNLIPLSISSTGVELIYDPNKKIYIHKGREGEFEQLPEIPSGLDESEFMKQDKFVGVVEDTIIKIRDLESSAVTGKIATKFFHTLTGNNKSLIISFTAPLNFQEQMEEVARVMTASIKDEVYVPGNKSDAESVSVKKDIGGIMITVPSSFQNEKDSDLFYKADAYENVFDKAYGINMFLKKIPDRGKNIAGYGLHSEELKDLIEKELSDYLYEDLRTLKSADHKEPFNMLVSGQTDVIYDNKDSVEYNFYAIPNKGVYRYRNAKVSAPIRVIATAIPYIDGYIINFTTYNESNYEMAKVYNNAILRSIKNTNR